MEKLSTATFMSETGDEVSNLISTLQVTPKDTEEYNLAVRNLKELEEVRSIETRRAMEAYESLDRMDARRKLDPNTVVTAGAGLIATLALIGFEAFGSGIVTSKAPDIVSKVFRR